MDLTRYYIGGDLWAQVVTQYGAAAGDQIASAAQTGDGSIVNATLSDIRRGTTNANYSTGTAPGVNGSINPGLGSTSAADNFLEQITTNPLGAPLDSANGILSNTLLSFLKNPAVLVAVAVLLFLALGGFSWAQRQIAKQ